MCFKLFKDYGCIVDNHPWKANVVVDVLRSKTVETVTLTQ